MQSSFGLHIHAHVCTTHTNMNTHIIRVPLNFLWFICKQVLIKWPVDRAAMEIKQKHDNKHKRSSYSCCSCCYLGGFFILVKSIWNNLRQKGFTSAGSWSKKVGAWSAGPVTLVPSKPSLVAHTFHPSTQSTQTAWTAEQLTSQQPGSRENSNLMLAGFLLSQPTLFLYIKFSCVYVCA